MGLAPEDPEALREGMSKSWVGRGVNPDPFQVQKELAQSDLSASLTTCPPVLSLTHPNYGGLEHHKPAPPQGLCTCCLLDLDHSLCSYLHGSPLTSFRSLLTIDSFTEAFLSHLI